MGRRRIGSAVRSPGPVRILALAALFVLAGTVLALPSARAQTDLVDTHLTVTFPEDVGNLTIIRPGQTRTYNLTVVYAWEPGGYSFARTEIRFEATRSPSWATVEFVPEDFRYVQPPAVCPPSRQCPTPGPAGNVTFIQQVNVTIDEEAPSFEPDWFTVEATAEPNTAKGNLEGSSDETDQTRQLAAGALPEVRITSSESFIQIRGGETRTIPVDVQNTGNVEVLTRLDARDLPEGIEVEVPSEVEVNRGGTTTVNMTVRVDNPLFGERAGFLLEAVPRHKQDPAVRGPRATAEVTVSVTPLPQAMLLGQMTPTEVFLFTGGLVTVFFVVGWPMTVWWEERRKRSRAADRREILAGDEGSGSIGSDPGSASGYGSGTASGPGPAPGPGPGDGPGRGTRTASPASAVGPGVARAHGVPEEGDDYVVVDESEFDVHFKAASGAPAAPAPSAAAARPAPTAEPAHATGRTAQAAGTAGATAGPSALDEEEGDGDRDGPRRVHGVPAEGDDYVIADDDAFDEHFKRAE